MVKEERKEPYLVFSIGGKPVLSVPARLPGVKWAGIQLFKATSWRRRLFKEFFALCVLGRIDGLFGGKYTSPVPVYPHFPFEAFLNQIRTEIGVSDVQVVVTFPSTLERGRFYVNLLSLNAEQLGFAKVSTDAVMNDLSLAREAETIKRLLGSSMCSFEFPKIISEGKTGLYRYTVFEPLPNNARPIKANWDGTPQSCRDELAAGSYRVQRIEKLSWWSLFQSVAAKVTPLADEINSWTDRDATVCWAHGDYTRSNMCHDGGRVWVFDWEDSAPDAPIMTDEVRFFLEAHGRMIVNDPQRMGRLLARRFLTSTDGGAKNMALALAFLCSRENVSGVIMGKRWHQIKSEGKHNVK